MTITMKEVLENSSSDSVNRSSRRRSNYRLKKSGRNYRDDNGIYSRATKNSGVDTRPENEGRSNFSKFTPHEKKEWPPITRRNITQMYDLPVMIEAFKVDGFGTNPRNKVNCWHLVEGMKTWIFQTEEAFEHAVDYAINNGSMKHFEH